MTGKYVRSRMPGAGRRSTLTALVAGVLLALTGSLLVATNAAATPSATPPKPAEATTKATKTTSAAKKASAEVCGGAISWYTVVSCAGIEDGQEHAYTLPSLEAPDRLLFRMSEANPDARVVGHLTAPDGTQCIFSPFPDVRECAVGEAGTYRITVDSDGSSAYTLSVASIRSSACTPLSAADLSPTAPGRTGDLAATTVGDCYQFAGVADDIVQIGGGTEIVTIYDAGATEVCGSRFYQPTSCTMTGTGPYRALVLQPRENQTAYTLRLAKLNDATGCPALAVAPFGTPGTATVGGTLAPEATTCRSVTLSAGRHAIRTYSEAGGFGDPVTFSFYDHAGRSLCDGSSRDSCEIPADGTYLLEIGNYRDQALAFGASVIALRDTRGCAPEVGTDWNLPVLSKPNTVALQLDCQPIKAVAGDRLMIRSGDPASVRVVDRDGVATCERSWGQQECVLEGTGPYRVLSTGNSDSGEYQLDFGRLTNPAGCAPLALTKFGVAPPAGPDGSRCRELTVTTPATYMIESGMTQGDEVTQRKPAYGTDGLHACENLARCSLQAGQYFVITPQTARIAAFPVTATDGCVPQPADAFTPVRGTMTSYAQFDCVQLNAPAGAVLLPIEPSGADLTSGVVLDATGAELCLRERDDNPCKLTGTAPFRALLTSRVGQNPSSYAFTMPRIDETTGCQAFPQGDFTTPGGVSLALRPDRFAACLTIPAGAHSTEEIVQFNRTAGTGTARIFVLDSTGREQCASNQSANERRFCLLDTGSAYQAYLVGSDATSTYQAVRRDVTAGAKGCGAVGSTVVGTTAASGTTDRTQVRCHKLTGATTDKFLMNTRDATGDIGMTVLGPDGQEACRFTGGTGCLATGFASYQVIVQQGGAVVPGAAYKLEAFKVATAAGPAAECTKVANSGYGFGPFTGELTTARTATCTSFPMVANKQLTGQAVNLASGGPELFVSGIGSANGENCNSFGDGQGGFSCYGWSTPSWNQIIVLSLPEDKSTSVKYRLSAGCDIPLCGGAVFGVSGVTPASAAAGTTATLTVTGKSLHLKDVVRLTASGLPAVAGVVKTVSADRTKATVTVNLAGVAPGVRTLAVGSFAGETVTLAKAFTVGPKALAVAGAPTVVGPVRVGAVVRSTPGKWVPAATGYTYQWRDNGVAIRGASAATYTPVAAMVGHKLSVTVTGSRAGSTSAAATSAGVLVTAGLAPVAKVLPVLKGTVKAGKAVTVSAGTWAPACTSYRYQWYSAGKAVASGTKSGLVLTAAMAKKTVYAAVTCGRTGHASGRAVTKTYTVAA
ncbi:hypothetical protein [Kribbella ginsengisoli]|uniref:Ig-like domain-containing protein n=1 Tax=Kribbella ginsengisoli TaxID=363865 RepID=A0ABP6XKF0_9ACTN